uniref:ectopic P granules protein 5 homolog n=1 Tax=Myxine glutinosa TaxID=7769 RepID=UPI00358F4E9A
MAEAMLPARAKPKRQPGTGRTKEKTSSQEWHKNEPPGKKSTFVVVVNPDDQEERISKTIGGGPCTKQAKDSSVAMDDGRLRTEEVNDDNWQMCFSTPPHEKTESHKSQVAVENEKQTGKVGKYDGPLPTEMPAIFDKMYPSLSDIETPTGFSKQHSEFKDENVFASCQVDTAAVLCLEEQYSTIDLLRTRNVSGFKQKLYPSLVSLKEGLSELSIQHLQEQSVMVDMEQAFTRERLRVLWPYPWLAKVEVLEEQLLLFARQESHELQELLANYLRCRRQLAQAQAQLKCMDSQNRTLKDRLWVFTNEQVVGQGYCANGALVRGVHHYQSVEMDESVFSELGKTFEECSELVHQTMTLHVYTASLSRLQVESYLYNMLENIPAISAMFGTHSKGTTIADCLPSEVLQLKKCISVLFSFTRRPISDLQFTNDIQAWLHHLVGVLHRIRNASHEVFLLYHLLRLPAGLAAWAVPFLQIRMDRDFSSIDHFMEPLAMFMSPARNRIDFLCLMNTDTSRSSSNEEAEQSDNWTLVDEAGEEDESDEQSWHLLDENDLLCLYSQFPFHKLFQHLLGIQGSDPCTFQRSSNAEIMLLFAQSNAILDVLATGLETFNRARYRQLVKRIGRTMRLMVSCVSERWQNFLTVSHNAGSSELLRPYSLQKLQTEFDELFVRTTFLVFKAKRLGIWQFMVEMPYSTLSRSTAWRLLYSMHHAESDELDTCTRLDLAKCKKELQEMVMSNAFEEYLITLDSFEAICLLTSFSKMAQAQKDKPDKEFIRTVALEIYQISYVSTSTRELCSKVGRELLPALTAVHPWLITLLLARTKDTLQDVGMACLFLFKELPLALWKPTSADIVTLGEWLVEHELNSLQNKLACLVLEDMHWGFGLDKATLVLDCATHIEVALLLIEAYQHALLGKPYVGLVNEGIKQVSYLGSLIRSTASPEQLFHSWAWGLAFKLRPQVLGPRSCTTNFGPDLKSDVELHHLLTAVEAKIPLGCFLAFAITSIGYSVDKFCSDGIPLLALLVETRNKKAAILVLAQTLPLFYSCPSYLLKNQRFMKTMQLFLQHEGWTRQSDPGSNTSLLAAVIQTHIAKSAEPNAVGVAAVLDFWANMLTAGPVWHRDPQIRHLLDHVCRAAFCHHMGDGLMKIFYQLHETSLGCHGDKGLISSLMSWVVTGNISPSFIEGDANGKEVWLAWIALNAEASFEENPQLRKFVEMELQKDMRISADQALKVAQSRLKLQYVPTVQRLMIYRWLHQALATPTQHPLLPLIWQKFFLLYLHRPDKENGLPYSGAIGWRFFKNSVQKALLDNAKERLGQIAEYHHKAMKARPTIGCQDEPAAEEAEDFVVIFVSRDQHNRLFQIFRTFKCWLDNDDLQKTDPYPPSLPAIFASTRLVRVFNNEQDLWLEFVDMGALHEHSILDQEAWLSLWFGSGVLSTAHNSPTSLESVQNMVQSFLQDHKVQQSPLPFPNHHRAPLQPLPPACHLKAEKLVCMDLQILTHQAESAARREAQQATLDSDFLEYLPNLYFNKDSQIVLKLRCNQAEQKCIGPAKITLKFAEAQRDKHVAERLQVTGSEIDRLQTEACNAPAHAVPAAAVHTENIITALINTHKNQHSSKVQEVGEILFYLLTDFVTGETRRYPPTRQFLSSCVAILGQVFIAPMESCCSRLLDTMLAKRSICTLLSPHFEPNAAPTRFPQMLNRVAHCAATESGDTVFMLLTKFRVAQWLSSTQPPLALRQKIVEDMHGALCSLGPRPAREKEALFGLLCQQWKHVLTFQFPDLYGDSLKLLLNGCAERILSPGCWNVLLNSLCSNRTASEESRPPILDQPAPAKLSHAQVQETVKWLSTFFLSQRLDVNTALSFGLYPVWKAHLEYLSKFYQFLAQSMIRVEADSLLNSKPERPALLAGVQSIYASLLTLFEPWILPLEVDNKSSSHSYPWIDNDVEQAVVMVRLFTQCVGLIYELFKSVLPTVGPSPLHLLWSSYCHDIARVRVPEHILAVFHEQLKLLPWANLHLDIAALESILLAEREEWHSSILFLGWLVGQMHWEEIIGAEFSPLHARSLLCVLLHVLVILAKESSLLGSPDSGLDLLLSRARTFPWHNVDITTYQMVSDYVLDHYPANMVICLPEEPRVQILHVLKAASGMLAQHGTVTHKDASEKSLVYLEMMVKMLSQDLSHQSVAFVLTDMLESIQGMDLLGLPPAAQFTVRANLLTELLSLLNQARPEQAKPLEKALVTWFESHPCNPLVLPALSAAGRALASIQHLATMTEACIADYFIAHCQAIPTWEPVLATLRVPELTREDFLQECVSRPAPLTLYAYVLQWRKEQPGVKGDALVLHQLMQWMQQAFPKTEQQESSMLLWWHVAQHILSLQLQHNQLLPMSEGASMMLALVKILLRLAEDKTSGGILGAIGLGRRSPLSQRFRLAARCTLTYLMTRQLPDESLHIAPATTLQLIPQAAQALSSLENLLSNKQYQEFQGVIEYVCWFIKEPKHTLHDANTLLAILANMLYPNAVHLAVVRTRPEPTVLAYQPQS